MQIKATEEAKRYTPFDQLEQLHFKLVEMESTSSSDSESNWRLRNNF